MPALTNSRLGSSNSSGALGTTVWPLSPKNRNHRRRISAVSMGIILAGVGALRTRGCRGGTCCRARGRRAVRWFAAGQVRAKHLPPRSSGGRGAAEAGVVTGRLLDQRLAGAWVDGPLVDAEREPQLGVPLRHGLADDLGH